MKHGAKAQIKLREEGYNIIKLKLSWERSNNAVVKDAQIKSREEECVAGIEHITTLTKNPLLLPSCLGLESPQ